MITMDSMNFRAKTVLVRIDVNCPLNPNTGEFLGKRRIREHAKTIRELAENGAKVAILAHQGRVGTHDFTTTEKHTDILSRCVGTHVKYVPDVMGLHARREIKNMQNGDVIMLENVRFLAEETVGSADTYFVRVLEPLVGCYVGDAFGVAHRKHTSVVGFPSVLPSCAGRVMQSEIDMLDKIKESIKRPIALIMGGSKLGDFLGIIDIYSKKKIADKICTGFPVQGKFDIDNNTLDNYKSVIRNSSTVIMGGTLGRFEDETYRNGTNEILKTITDSSCFSIIAGGHLSAAVEMLDLENKMSYISTGGKSCLLYLAGEKLPGIEAIV